ncbi:hypothetical protein E4U13_002559 [Claviceps humidiphila]|uniref:Uncharacterized protein n=1 Tax=Claviceps humidiphila TaxID=1294629 RepID=A0A9P7PZP4_9HYPO|nr:hypothetical protein E4U13_002559 [Claviceps humidiphila]
MAMFPKDSCKVQTTQGGQKVPDRVERVVGSSCESERQNIYAKADDGVINIDFDIGSYAAQQN